MKRKMRIGNAPITMHVMITTLCNRNCKYCCNNSYSIDEIPTATEDDFRRVDYICLTGGEPFLFTNPNEYAKKFKREYPHIEKVWVYSNAVELRDYLNKYPTAELNALDGISCSIKVHADAEAFKELLKDERIAALPDNLCYVFNNLLDTKCQFGNFKLKDREWQAEFTPAADSIFRRI